MEALKINAHIGEDGKITVDTPLKNCDVELLILIEQQSSSVTHPKDKKSPLKKYDFSDLTGKLEWSGDFLEEQKKLRNEWD